MSLRYVSLLKPGFPRVNLSKSELFRFASSPRARREGPGCGSPSVSSSLPAGVGRDAHRRVAAVGTNVRCSDVLLVGLDHTRPKDPRMSLGVASIVANLQIHAVPHRAISENVSDQNFTLAPVLREAMSVEFNSPNADTVVGAFVWNEVYMQELLSALRQNGYRGRIGVAGPQVSYAGKGTLERLYPGADYFVRGYAEDAIVALASARGPGTSSAWSAPSPPFASRRENDPPRPAYQFEGNIPNSLPPPRMVAARLGLASEGEGGIQLGRRWTIRGRCKGCTGQGSRIRTCSARQPSANCPRPT